MRLLGSSFARFVALCALAHAITLSIAFPLSIQDTSRRSLPSMPDGLSPYSSPPTNSTSSKVTDSWPTICYFNPHQPLVTYNICQPLFRLLETVPDYGVSRTYSPANGTLSWMHSNCGIFVHPGEYDSVFSISDIVITTMSILETCQPSTNPFYTGTGGQAPLSLSTQIWRRDFIVQVHGSAPGLTGSV